MRNIEHQQAVALMQWWAYYANTKKIDQRLLFAIPNGGARHIAVARKLKAEGVRAGVSDYFLAVPSKGMHGLFLELKSKDGRATPEQWAFGEKVSCQGYQFDVVYGTEDAIKAIEGYLK